MHVGILTADLGLRRQEGDNYGGGGRDCGMRCTCDEHVKSEVEKV